MVLQTIFAFNVGVKTYTVLYGVNKHLPFKLGKCLPPLYSVYEWSNESNCYCELSGFFGSVDELISHYDLSNERKTAIQLLDAYKLNLGRFKLTGEIYVH